jgi:hypothetical protein
VCTPFQLEAGLGIVVDFTFFWLSPLSLTQEQIKSLEKYGIKEKSISVLGGGPSPVPGLQREGEGVSIGSKLPLSDTYF